MGNRLNCIAQNMLTLALSSQPERDEGLCAELAHGNRYFLVATSNTTKAEWEDKTFAAAVEDNSLVVFLSPDEAAAYATRKGALLGSSPMTMKATKSTLSALVNTYLSSKRITHLKIFSKVPLFILCPAAFFMEEGVVRTSQSVVMAEPPEFKGTSKFLLSDKVKAIFDTYDNAARRKLDPSAHYENLHALIEELVMTNRIDPHDLDLQYDLPDGFTKNFCLNRVSSATSKPIILKYLEHFGLVEYLYLFKDSCSELAAEIKENHKLDLYQLKTAKINTKERFRLMGIRRGHDYNGAFVYGLQLQSKKRSFALVLSNPFGWTVGKEYEVIGLTPEIDETESESVIEKISMPTQEMKEDVLNKIEAAVEAKRKPKLKTTERTEAAPYEEERKTI